MRNSDVVESNSGVQDKKMRQTYRNFFAGLIMLVVLFGGILTTNLLLQQQSNQNVKADTTNLNACGLDGGFCETFDGAPTTPLPLGGIAGKNVFPRWVMAVHSRDNHTFETLETQNNVMHGHDCGAPPATHSNNAYEGAVFNCRNHVMTAMTAGGYGLITMTPNAMVNFSQGPAIVQWEMSTNKQSQRDWPDIWITPYDGATILPYDAGDVDMQGPPKDAIHISGNNIQNCLIPGLYKNFQGDAFQEGWNCTPINTGIAAGTNQDATRQTFRATITRTHIKLERLASATAPALVLYDGNMTDAGFDKGVVQFAHHIYNPEKDGAGVAATWHWDTIAINPAIPFTLIHADKRMVESTNSTITFDSAAPANSLLRFAAIGTPEISFNNGSTWTTIPKQLSVGRAQWSPYSIAVPEGTKSVNMRLKNDDWYSCSTWPCIATDFSIWSLTAPSGSSPLPTVANPSITINQQPTNTPTPIPTSTPIPTLTAIPTPTRTPTPTIFPSRTPTPTGGVGGPQVTNTLVPPSPTATAMPPTPIPTPVPCALNTASWSTTQSTQGQAVTLNVTGNSSCNGKSISFVVQENDSVLEGIGDDPVTINPASAIMSNGIASTTWISEWQDDGLLGADPEYFFNATYQGSTIRSVDPLLTVIKSNGQTPVTQSGSRINYLGKNWYLSGANVAWYNWGCDFGCNSNGGVTSTKSTIATAFAKMKAANMHVARWWVFPGDPWQITRDSSGAPSGLNPSIYADFDAALELAEQYDIYFNFVLFSAATSAPRSWITDSAQRAKLAQVLTPLFARYANNPRVMTWEIFNEPEFQVWNNEIDETSVVETGRAITNAVHNNSKALVTVGSAMLDGMSMWSTVNLDYYSPHWYDYMQPGNWCALCQSTTQVRSLWPTIGNKPIVIGEAYLGSDINPLQRYTTFYNNGYAGVWGWTMFPDRTSDHMSIDQNASIAFAQGKTDFGPSSSAINPTATTAPTQPTNTPVPPTATPTPIPCSVSSASWNQSGPVNVGTSVSISVTTVGECSGKQVAFTVAENDSIIEGIGDDPVTTSPPPANIFNNHASTFWVAEYQEDGIGGVFDPPEYYVNVSIVGSGNTTRSSDPMLTVNKPVVNQPPTPTPILTTAPPTITPMPTLAPSAIPPTPTTKIENPLPTLTVIPTIPSVPAWVGQYYLYNKGDKTKGMNGTAVLLRSDPTINFNWGLGSPATNIRSDRFSARWTSRPTFEAGTYQFRTVSDDGIRVYLDGQLLTKISAWTDHGRTTKTQNVNVAAGQHTIVAEYYENTGFATAQFSYTKVQ